MNDVNALVMRSKVQMNHIRRLQEQNRELASMLAQERKLRREAYSWYQKRLTSRFMWIFDVWVRADKHGNA